MALARGTIIKPVEINLPVLQAPTELMYQAMIGMQSEKDMYSALASTTPKARTVDEPWRQEYTKYVQDLSDSVAQAFASGNTEYAMKSLRKAKTNVQELWKPGGLAYALEEGAIAEATEIARIKEAHEKDPTGAGNMMFALKRFRQGQQPLNYDYETGQYNRVGQADLYRHVVIPAELQELAKATVPDLTEQDFVTGAWIEKIKTKNVPPERLAGLFDAFIARPDVRSQLEVDYFSSTGIDLADYDFKGMDLSTPEGAKKFEFVAITKNALDKNYKTTKDVYTAMSDTDKQKYLKELGYYKGKIDGAFGKLSKEAEEAYLTQLEKSYTNNVTSLLENPRRYLIEDVAAAGHRQMFFNLFGKEYSHTLKENPYYLENLRFSHRKALQKNWYDLKQQYVLPQTDTTTVAPGPAIDFDTTLQNMIDTATGREKAANNMLGNIMKQPDVVAVLGTKGLGKEDVIKLTELWEKAQGMANPKQYFNSQAYGIIPVGANLEKMYDFIGTKGGELGSIVNDMESAAIERSRLQKVESEIVIETGALNDSYSQLKDKLPEGTTIQQFADMVQRASKMTVDEIRANRELAIFASKKSSHPEAIEWENEATQLWRKTKKEVTKTIKQTGKVPQALTSLVLHATSPKDPIAIANKQMSGMLNANKHVFVDAATGVTGELTAIGDSKAVNVDAIDMSKATAAMTTIAGKPVIQITTPANSKGDSKVYQVEVPSQNSNMRDIALGAIRQKVAMALNNGDTKMLLHYSSILSQVGLTDTDMGYRAIEVNNRIAIDPDEAPVTTASGGKLSSAYTPVKSVSMQDRVGNEYTYNIITWGNDNGKRWGITFGNTLLGPVQIADTEAGLGVTFDNTRSVSDSGYTRYEDVLTALEAVNQGMNLPVEEELKKAAAGAAMQTGESESVEMNIPAYMFQDMGIGEEE